MNLKELLKQIIRAYDPTIDLSDTSVISDLLVNPASVMMDPFVAQLKFLVTNLGLKSPESITEEELDALASNFLVYRNQGAKVTGYVELFYDTPQSVSIKIGDTFSTKTGQTFEVSSENGARYISKADMAGNTWNFPLYSTGKIPVTATNTGSRYSIDANTITSTSVAHSPIQVTNPAAFGSGVSKETNTELVTRLLASVQSHSFASSSSIQSTLQALYPSIISISTRGMGDSEMMRDVVYSGLNAFSNRVTRDYNGKVVGYNDSPYPQSKAYYQLFYDDPTTSGIINDLPFMEEFIFEFTDDQYAGIFNLNADSTKLALSKLMNETFTGPNLPVNWVASDATQDAVGKVVVSDEIKIDNNRLLLGKLSDASNMDATPITIMPQAIYNILNHMRQIAMMGTPSQAQAQKQKQTITNYSDLKTIWP